MKIRELSLGLCVLLVGLTTPGAMAQELPTGVDQTHAFIHPGILHNRTELDFIRARVNEGEEPWASAWQNLPFGRSRS